MKHLKIPVVDLFAGPGGLGEGFAASRSGAHPRFTLVVSIEKDPVAHQTLRLRSFVRQFRRPPDAYYARLRGELQTRELFSLFPHEAQAAEAEACRLELKAATAATAARLIERALGGCRKAWVLIGGPPCQAYSLVGRSRMRGADRAAYEADGRHFLYREYLRILKRFHPPVFVMENVKGILSSTVGGLHTFSHILADMKDAGYTLHSFVRSDVDGRDPDPASFVVRAEDYGIPQARHRVIILGIREGLERGTAVLRPQIFAPTTRDAIGDLPPIRSALSKQADSTAAWLDVIRSFRPGRTKAPLERTMASSLRQLRELTLGDEFVPWSNCDRSLDSGWLQENRQWILDDRIGGVTHHSARAHMASDLHRYFFASCFARTFGLSPRLRDFPRQLLPDHANAEVAVGTSTFSDRFRVQLENQPSTTIVSHIRKDGHYYIHYDPTQCRSLTVREAARLQTFPDNYFFEGTRTEQYLQVGNAVPPLLAVQLADVVAHVLSQLTS